ncbi:MAG: dihydroorotate dehydrogenase electron transfer subunit, partial [Clostridia bacterium]|nr:dihydroorotate dehydrogenase electron transfer subunit [Clostridia bacterium]
MNQQNLTVLSNVPLTDTVFEMKLRGDMSVFTAPGQFVNLRLDGFYLRRPISVCDIEGDVLTLVYKVVGHGTEAM